MKGSTRWYDAAQLRRISEVTIAHYDRFAEAYWDGTRDHDVSQNYAALLDAIEGDPPYSILDLGCGPGRDLSHFRSLGHEAVGLDGSQQFVAIPCAQRGIAEGSARIMYGVEAARCAVLLKPERKQRGGL